ncbi:MAG: AAA-like domain-containing protein [Gammaproteobacteria bacterium]
MKRVFISYRHVKPDEDVALALEHALNADGHEVFVDRRILVGTQWAEEIDRQIRAAQFFVVLLSAESILSDMVRQEIKLAHELKQQKNLRILPVRVDFSGALPYDLGGYLNPLQYAVWNTGTSLDDIAAAIRLAIQDTAELPHSGRSVEQGDSQTDLLKLHEATEKRGAPLPQIDPRVLELAMERGSMTCDSPFYVRRPADDELERQLNRNGSTTIVKGGRQVGKSSLLVRAAAQARKRGCKVCNIDFQGIDEPRLADLNSLLLYLMSRIARDLKTPGRPKDYWDDGLGPKDSATDFVEQAVLADPEKMMVLLLDEVDRVFQYGYRNDFFALLRFWTNRRANSPAWERFNLVVAHATDPVLWIDDINQSPFNVGNPIVLGDFDPIQFADLCRRYGMALSNAEAGRLRELIGGHPYLARQSLYLLATAKTTLEELERLATRQDGPFGDHLRRLTGILIQREPLRKTTLQILQGKACEDEHSFQRLYTAGLVVGASRQEARLRCRLYEEFFRAHL